MRTKSQNSSQSTENLLKLLGNVGIATYENRQKIQEISGVDDRYHQIVLLARANMLTDINFTEVYKRTQNAQVMCNILHELDLKAQEFEIPTLLCEENYLAVNKVHDTESAIELLTLLSGCGLLDTRARANITGCANPYYLSEFFKLLFIFSNTDTALANIQIALHFHRIFSSERFYGFLTRIPNFLLTQDFIDSLMLTCQFVPDEEIFYANLTVLVVRGLALRLQAEAEPEINPSQSTHTASVHQSVADSLERLNDRYKDVAKPFDAKKFAATLNSTNYPTIAPIKLEAAKRALTTTIPEISTSRERATGISIDRILSLVWAAMHDTKVCKVDIQTCYISFINHLYEIQRGYNLDKVGKDDMKAEDLAICVGGTINQLLDTLNGGLHPDVEIINITKETASAKFNALTREFIVKQIKTAPNLVSLIKELKQEEKIETTDGVNKKYYPVTATITESIRPEALDQLKTEFYSEFKDYLAIKELDKIFCVWEYVTLEEQDLLELEKAIPTPIEKTKAISESLSPNPKATRSEVQDKTSQKLSDHGLFHAAPPQPKEEYPVWLIILFCIPIVGQLGFLFYKAFEAIEACFPESSLAI